MPRTRKAKKLKDAAKILGVPVAVLRTYVGEDDNPSPILKTLAKIGGDPDAWELSQDGAECLADIGDVLIRSMQTGTPNLIPLGILQVVLVHFPELKADIEALQK